MEIAELVKTNTFQSQLLRCHYINSYLKDKL